MPDVREKLVELLSEEYKYGTYEDMADGLIANGVTIQRWIPVEERLPEPLEAVLVYDSIDKCGSLAYMANHQEWSGIMTKSDVTHWMPLPQTPKEE